MTNTIIAVPINVSWRHYQKTQFLERSSNFIANPQILHCMKTSSHESTTTSIQPQHTIAEWTSPSIRCLNLLPLLYVRLCCFDQLEPEDVGYLVTFSLERKRDTGAVHNLAAINA
jgi:hypothetical protein